MTSESLAAMEPMRVLIVGAGGFAGRHLLSHLQDTAQSAPLHITATVLSSQADLTPSPDSAFAEERGEGREEGSGKREENTQHPTPEYLNTRTPSDSSLIPHPSSLQQGGEVEIRQLDICDAEAVQSVMAEVRPHYIYHLAARASGADTDRDAVFAVNVGGTRNLLEAASNVKPFPRVLVISTGYVYGETDPERPAREDDPIGPLWKYGPYTDSKIEMESVARSYRGFAVIVRPFSHIGPGQEPNFAIASFARQLARIERGLEPPELKVGNLDARRDLLDVRDVVRAYRLLMLHAQPGETYNIALGRPVVLRDALETLRSLCAVPTQVVVDPARLRPADIACSTGDTFALRALTGWQPQFSLADTLRDTLDFWRNSPRLLGDN